MNINARYQSGGGYDGAGAGLPVAGMKVTATELPGVLVIQPPVFRDARGRLTETWHIERFRSAGLPDRFVQDNVSVSYRGVLRGLHYQHPNAQGKLVWAVSGEIFDVAVDILRGSPTFGRWVARTLTDRDAHQLYIPKGFAHGFVALSETAVVCYKCTAAYDPEAEGRVRWDDPELAIDWPIATPLLSDKDRDAPLLGNIPPERLPRL